MSLPDIINGTFLIEHKVYSTFHSRVALGNGSARCGGAPSTADGFFIAFGNTLESLRKRVLGLTQVGTPDEAAFDRTTGQGYVAACDGDYADALRKRFSVVLFACEANGALSRPAVRYLKNLSRLAQQKFRTDGTVYGSSRLSTRSFFVHHLAAISSAITTADTLTIENAAAALTFQSVHFPHLRPAHT